MMSTERFLVATAVISINLHYVISAGLIGLIIVLNGQISQAKRFSYAMSVTYVAIVTNSLVIESQPTIG